MSNPYDAAARLIFQAAIDEDRCGELFECLLEGGSATVDANTGRLVLASAAQIAALMQRPRRPS